MREARLPDKLVKRITRKRGFRVKEVRSNNGYANLTAEICSDVGWNMKKGEERIEFHSDQKLFIGHGVRTGRASFNTNPHIESSLYLNEKKVYFRLLDD